MLFIPSTSAQSQTIQFFNTSNTSTVSEYSPTSVDQQQAVTIIENIANLDLSKYSIGLIGEELNTYLGRAQNTVTYSLSASQGDLRATCSFIDNKLHLLYISDVTGSVSLKDEKSSEIDATKSFLQNYQDHTENAFYGTLSSMLSDVKPNENTTKTSGNVNLKVTVLGESKTDFLWKYVDATGVSAQSKDVLLSYDNGRLVSFLDNWDLYTIEGTVKVSGEDAVKIALSAIQNYTYDACTNDGNVTISDLTVTAVGDSTLSYLNELDSTKTRNDNFSLYPSWYIPLGFDKVYEGCVTGAVVRVWADTGEVSSINLMIYEDDSQTNASNKDTTMSNFNLTSISNVFLAILVAISMISCSAYIFIKRPRFTCIKSLVLCGIITFSLIATVIPTVNATGNSKANVYASYWGQVPEEITAASDLTYYINSLFGATGYAAYRNSGGFNASDVYANIQYDESNYNRVAVFHFGHMANPGNYHCSPTDADIVEYSAVSGYTSGYMDKHFFVCLWVCNSALDDYYAVSSSAAAQAWTQRSNLATDGITGTGSGPDCFIGFGGQTSGAIGMSPPLSYAIFDSTTVTGSTFIGSFYNYALGQGYTIEDSLNLASLYHFGDSFTSSDLWTGYTAWYPGGNGFDPQWAPGRMYVYGNAEIYLTKYVSSIAGSGVLSYGGDVYNPSGLIGRVPNAGSLGDCAGVCTYYPGGAAYICGYLNAAVTGGSDIYLYATGATGYTNVVYVYVSTDNYNWYQVGGATTIPGDGTISSRYIGHTTCDYQYVNIVYYGPVGCVYIDSVLVTD